MSLLAAEPLIVERLRTLVPEAKVLCAEDLDGIEESDQPTPALHVVYSGFRVTETSGRGTAAMTNQTWLVVAVVKHAGQSNRAASEVKQRARPLVDAAVNALMGWRPALNITPLQLASGPAPRWRSPYYYFPLAFTASVPVEAAKR